MSLVITATDTPELLDTTSLSYAFLACLVLVEIPSIGDWNVTNVTSMTRMFDNVTLSTSSYDALLIGWEAQDVQSGVHFDGGSSKYSPGPAAEARQRLIDEHGWVIQDGGEVP